MDITVSVPESSNPSTLRSVLAALRECLENIEGPARDLILMRYQEGKSVLELQQKTGRGYSALTMQLHRIRCSLAACIESKANLPSLP